MTVQINKIGSIDDFEKTVGSLVYLIDDELQVFEEKAAIGGEGNLVDIAQQLPKVIALVTFIGYFRGQQGTFLHCLTGFGNAEMKKVDMAGIYQIEYAFEERAGKLIEAVKANGVAFEQYAKKMDEYFRQMEKGKARI